MKFYKGSIRSKDPLKNVHSLRLFLFDAPTSVTHIIITIVDIQLDTESNLNTSHMHKVSKLETMKTHIVSKLFKYCFSAY